MDKYNKLKIEVQSSEWEAFKTNLTLKIGINNWKKRNDFEKKFYGTLETNKEILCVETSDIPFRQKILHAVMWFWMSPSLHRMELFNIVSLINNYLECDEYNHIITTFHKEIIEPMESSFDLQVFVSNHISSMQEILGDDVFKKLLNFSNLANKSTGNTNSFDFGCWCDFVFAVFKNNIALSSTDLQNWLMENGWLEEMANKLSIDYEYTIEVLTKYEHDRY